MTTRTALPLRSVHTPDRQVQEVQAALRQVTRADNARGPVGVLTASTTIAAGQTLKVLHTLGRSPTKWSVVDVTGGPPAIYRAAWDATSITITAAALSGCTFVLELR